MVKKNQYGPDVYKRLELVRKQFQQHEAEKKKQQSAERKRRISSYLRQNKIFIARIALYVILAAVVFSVIWVLIRH
jgi:hypothetical protein